MCKKRTILMLAFTLATTVGFAVPAKRGVWKTIKLEDGTEVRVTLCGDEHLHYWQDANGIRYQRVGEIFQTADMSKMKNEAQIRRAKAAQHRHSKLKRAMRRASTSTFQGTKKGLIILAEFKNLSFLSGHDQTLFNNIANTEGYNRNGYKGSVRDYFRAQSDGQFTLDFDVVGPVQVSKNYSYYGANDQYDNDVRPEELIVEACKLADSQVNFADYDWDGDGEVDQVFVLYAGYGEADYPDDTNVIWPHEYELAATNKSLRLDGVIINTYACGSELAGTGQLDGIGTFCHEFSHCLGYPDMYDTNYDGYFGMGSFDLMCSGSYNDDSFTPPNYSAYEKMVAGWITPVELTADTEVTNLKPVCDGGNAYIIYNDAHKDEYYLLENRQQNGYDAYLPDDGLMITHVDYDPTIWEYNMVNTIDSYYDVSNNHERLTIFHADNEDDKRFWDTTHYWYTNSTEETDLYPANGNNSLTNTSKPAAKLYNANTDGTKYMNKSVTDITQNSDGTVSFSFKAADEQPETPAEGTLLHETFDLCSGKGGNDGLWSGQIAQGAFNTDMEGWTGVSASGANACAKFGTSKKAGSATTPAFTVNGQATISFKAAPWGSESTTLTVSVSGDATISPSSFTMTKSSWTDFTATINGSGSVKVTFSNGKRFFLDEVNASSITNAVSEIKVEPPTTDRIFSLDGRYVGTDRNRLSRGIYIMNGKKVVVGQ